MTEFKRERRFIVAKLKHLTEKQINDIEIILQEANHPEINAVVIEDDRPEYEKVWELLKANKSSESVTPK